jgi:O-antigen ligase
MKPKNKQVFLWVFAILFFGLCAGSLFLTTPLFVNEQITPKWYWTVFCSAALLLAGIVFSFFTKNKTTADGKIMPIICLTVVSLCLLQALFGILQYFHTVPASGNFPITGSFDNPAGFAACLCAGFPFVFYFVFSENRWKRYAAIIAGIIPVAAVVLSASRAGIISIIAVCLAVFFYKVKIAAKWRQTIAIALLLISLSGLYFLKKDSADGRLLIWRCSWEMIKDKPLFGYGYGGFKAHYMNYQAHYFETHPDSEYAMLADNVRHPFNEYLLLLTNFGLFGLLALFVALYRLWKVHKQKPDNPLSLYIACGCLLSIGVFAMFSYPLRYPFVLIMGLLSLYMSGFFRKRLLLVEKVVLTGAILFVCYLAFDRMLAEMKWNRIAHQSLLGKTEQMLPEYRLLHNKLRKNDLFLYNYTAELNVAKRYDESLQIGRECERFLADYDLQMLIADNYKQLKQYREAERYYIKASQMCPVKFMPLYELTNTYVEEGKETEALALANTIMSKRIKVPSANVFAIKKEMRGLIDRINNKHNLLEERQDKVSSEESLETVLPP